jgi:hypothetical protein
VQKLQRTLSDFLNSIELHKNITSKYTMSGKGPHKRTHKNKTHIPLVSKRYRVPIIFEHQIVKDVKGEIEIKNGKPIATIRHWLELGPIIVERIKQLYPHYAHESIGPMYKDDITRMSIQYHRTSLENSQDKRKASEAAAAAAEAPAAGINYNSNNQSGNSESSNEGSNNDGIAGALAGALAGAKIGNGKKSNGYNSNGNVKMGVETGGGKRTRRRRRSRK